MGLSHLAPKGCGIDAVDHDHEHLTILLNLAERSAVNGDRRHCARMLQRAIASIEEHAGRQEPLLMAGPRDQMLEVCRGHERLALVLEQILVRIEATSRGELVDELRRASHFLAECVAREAYLLRRFHMAAPAAAAVSAVA